MVTVCVGLGLGVISKQSRDNRYTHLNLIVLNFMMSLVLQNVAPTYTCRCKFYSGDLLSGYGALPIPAMT